MVVTWVRFMGLHGQRFGLPLSLLGASVFSSVGFFDSTLSWTSTLRWNDHSQQFGACGPWSLVFPNWFLSSLVMVNLAKRFPVGNNSYGYVVTMLWRLRGWSPLIITVSGVVMDAVGSWNVPSPWLDYRLSVGRYGHGLLVLPSKLSTCLLDMVPMVWIFDKFGTDAQVAVCRSLNVSISVRACL